MDNIVYLVAFILAHLSTVTTQAVDPYQKEATGSAVSRAAVDLVTNSGIFSDDHQFLWRIAQVESREGNDPNTHRDGYHGGIWQVDQIGFNDTQDVQSHPGLQAKFNAIKETFNIDWKTVTWQDLRAPVYSALAARIFLSNIPALIPKDIYDQAEYWKEHYNKNGAGTVKAFLERADKIKGDPHVSQIVEGSKTALCYDVVGQNGDIYNFLTEHSINMKVNVELGIDGRNGLARYITRLAVIIDKYQINIANKGIGVGGKLYPWSSDHIEVDHGVRHFQVIIEHNTINIGTSRVLIEVTKVPAAYLELTIRHIGAIDAPATGIVGYIAEHVRIEENERNPTLVVADDIGRTSSYSIHRKGDCWVLPEGNELLTHVVQKNKINCMEC